MVFQHYALFPHLTVAGNVAYGLADQRLDRGQVARRVHEVLGLVSLAGLEERPVAALSGGQQQRVALARALAPRPAVLLLDEPLSNLDPSLRERTRHELRELVQRIGITTVLVTHEQEEAFELADRIALLLDGTLRQVGTPESLYGEPASEPVARFVGRSSVVPGTLVERHGATAVVEALGSRFEATAPGDVDGTVRLLLRPEALAVRDDGAITARVVRRRFTGAFDLVTVAVGDAEVEVSTAPLACQPGAVLHLAPSGVGAHAFAEEE
jgi:ABC-type Fe3+/spermidine/putrescine transport system ATPase subunit